MVNSLKEIIEGITRIVEENLPEITKVKYSGAMNTDLPRDFPTLYLFCEDPSTLNENHNLITLQMHFADVQISQNSEWKKDYEIKSDMMQTASKLFDLLEVEGWLDTINIPLQPFTHDMNDGLSGVQCSVPFIVEKPCIIEAYEQGTPTPEPVTITITSPITGEEFEEGTDITVSYSLSTEEGVTDVALEIDGVETQRKTVIFDAFLISGLDVNSHSIVLKAYNGEELLDTSNTVSVDVVQIPLTITILTPSEGAEYTEGDDVIVSYEFNREYTEVDKVEFWINGVKEVELSPPIGAAFAAVAGEMLIETRAVDVANNTLASDTVTVTVAAVFEQETIDFMTAISVANDETVYQSGKVNEMTGAERWTAVNNLILQLKTDGLWPKLQRMGRLFSDDAAMAALDLINNSSFQGTYFGGWIHGFGSKGNGSNTYMTTGFVPSVQQVDGNSGLTYVAIAQNTASDSGGRIHIGAFISDGNNAVLGDVSEGDLIRYNASFQFTNPNNRLGVHTVSRNSSESWRKFTNGTFIKTDNGTGSNPPVEFYEGAWNNNGLAGLFSNATYGPTVYHEGLSDVEIGNLYTALENFCIATHIKTW